MNPRDQPTRYPDESGSVEPWFSLTHANKSKPSERNSASEPVVIIGAGLAGCSAAWSLNRIGLPALVLEAGPVTAGGASGNTRAVCKPHVNRNNPMLNAWYECAFFKTLQRLRTLESRGHSIPHNLDGLIQLVENHQHWPTLTSAQAVEQREASLLAGIELAAHGLHISQGGWIDASAFCRALLDDGEQTTVQTRVHVRKITRGRNQWQLEIESPDHSTRQTVSASQVILAAGPGTQSISADFITRLKLPLTISAGQTTRCRVSADLNLRLVITGKRYLIPDGNECTVGASHHRDVTSLAGCKADDDENLNALDLINPALRDSLEPVSHWRSIRSSTNDRLPLAGPFPDTDFYHAAYAQLKHGDRHQRWENARYLSGLWIFTGLGSRGMVSATHCADTLIRQMNGPEQHRQNSCDPDSQPGTSADQQDSLLHPARFLIRQLRRGSATQIPARVPEKWR